MTMGATRIIRRLLANLLFLAGICLHGFLIAVALNLAYYTYWPQQLELNPYSNIPRPSLVHGRLTLPYTGTDEGCSNRGSARAKPLFEHPSSVPGAWPSYAPLHQGRT